MAEEIEVKLRIRDGDEARRRLGGAGAVALSPRVFERNRVYDDARGMLRKSGRLLRLRTAGNVHLLTLKAKPPAGEDSGYKVRIEHESHVEDADAVHQVLLGLGYKVTYRYEKYRQPYRLGEVEVLLDETPIGAFLELEGRPRAIDDAARALGYSREDYVLKTYRQLHQEAAGTDDPGDLVFDAGAAP